MTNVKTMISAMAFAVALTPMIGAAAYSYGTQDTAYLSTPAAAYHLAANSKGRPAEFGNQVAVNSKGRPAEFTNQVAANSKGRPAEFADNSKGRPGERDQVATNSKGRPFEFDSAGTQAVG